MRQRLKLIAAYGLALAALYDISGHLHLGRPDGSSAFAGVLPSITLSPTSGQSANRLALDVSGLQSSRTITVAVNVTNAGNKAVSGVVANLVSSVPGMTVSAEPEPVAAGSTVQYKLHVTSSGAAGSLASLPSQIVVALSPKS